MIGADLSVFLRDFGIVASTERGTLLGIFDTEFVLIDGVEQTAPTLACTPADVERLQLVKGSTVEIEARSYRVRRVELERDGMTVLIFGA